MTCNRIKCLSDCTQNLVKFSAIARLTLKALCFWLWTGFFKVKKNELLMVDSPKTAYIRYKYAGRNRNSKGKSCNLSCQ